MPGSLIIRNLDTIPDLLGLHALNPERYPHLLNSNTDAIGADQNTTLARYDILFAFPQQTLQCDRDFLGKFDEAWQQQRLDIDEEIKLPFKGGWFVYLGYELAQQIEPALDLPGADDGLPVAFATRFPAAIIIDNCEQQAYLICEKQFESCFEQIEYDLQRAVDVDVYTQPFSIEQIEEDDEAAYLKQLEQLRRYIVDGDVFQVNLSRGWRTQLTDPVSHASIYHQLLQSNPGPFNALVTLGDKAVISSSPERLIECRDGWLQTRPIAGTRPRGEDQSSDQDLSTELLAHPKERAEHIMLIDLERNDLGRVCVAGSIEVNELMVLESYRHVHHIVSNVRGRPRAGVTPGQLIAAVFPGGTITGCPKVRCMEILAELEQVGRGAYTGSLGYINHDGSMDLNILIRTITRNAQRLQFRAGGGIVVDSKATHELKETRHKARGLLHALQTGNQ